MHPPAGLYFHFSSGATAFLAVTLTFLFLSGTTNGALRCIEDGTGSYSSAASNRVQQSVKPNGGNGGGGGGVASKDSLVKPSPKGTAAATANSIEQRQQQQQQQSNSNSMQRSYKTFSPIITRWKPYRTNGGTSSNGSTGFGSRTSPADSIRQQRQQQQQQQPQQRLMIPVGVSNYRPIQYVNDVKPGPFPRAYFDKVMATVFNRTSTSGGGGGANTTGGSYSSSSVAASSDISEVKLNDAQSGGDNEVEVMHPSRAHPPRFIELESSYVPLTIRFPSRTSRLNIIENSGDTASNTVDLVGQDSNRHDSFGRRTGSSSAKGTSGETSSSSKTAAASVPSSSGVRNLEARVLFGDAKREEPLVLKQDGKTNIPDNMQRIIKCIFPDFKFDGAEKVQSAC